MLLVSRWYSSSLIHRVSSETAPAHPAARKAVQIMQIAFTVMLPHFVFVVVGQKERRRLNRGAAPGRQG
jgi:hypothetical protein